MATSSIRITKICQWCGVEFEAQKVSTKYCSHRCANLAYKQAVLDKQKTKLIMSRQKNQLRTSKTRSMYQVLKQQLF